MQNLIDNAGESGGSVNSNAVRGVLFRLVQSLDELALRRPPSELVLWSLCEPSPQGIEIHFEDEDAVEQVDEVQVVPETAAEERRRLVLVGD